MWSRPHAFCTLHDCQCLRGIQKEALDIDYGASKTRLVQAFHHPHNLSQFRLYQNLTENCNANLLKTFRAVAKALHQCCLHLPGPSCAFRGRACGPGSWRVEMGWPIVGTETQTPRCSNTTCAAHVVYHPLFRCTRRGDQSLGFRLSYEKDTPEAQLNYLKNYKFNALWQP